VKLRVLVVGKGGCAWADAACEDYGRRVKRYGGIEESAVATEPFRGDVEAVRAQEAGRVLKQIAARDRLIVLDERGDDVDGPAWQGIIEHARLQGVPRLVFAIGGAYGHGPAVRAAATRVVRLSPLVLNHEVARVVLYEQLYRAMAAIHGVPYAH
jgi:23S rRNA (pseudouridine1915-N3)-methyltransferase